MKTWTDSMQWNATMNTSVGLSREGTGTIPMESMAELDEDSEGKNFIRLGRYRVCKRVSARFVEENVHMILNPTMVFKEIKEVIEGLGEEVNKDHLLVCADTIRIGIHPQSSGALEGLSRPVIRVGVIRADEMVTLEQRIKEKEWHHWVGDIVSAQMTSTLESSSESILSAVPGAMQTVSADRIEVEFDGLTSVGTGIWTVMLLSRIETGLVGTVFNDELDRIRFEKREYTSVLEEWTQIDKASKGDQGKCTAYGVLTIVSPMTTKIDPGIRVEIDIMVDVVITEYVSTENDANATYPTMFIGGMAREWQPLLIGKSNVETQGLIYASPSATSEEQINAATTNLKLLQKKTGMPLTTKDGMIEPNQYELLSAVACKSIVEIRNDSTDFVSIQIYTTFRETLTEEDSGLSVFTAGSGTGFAQPLVYSNLYRPTEDGSLPVDVREFYSTKEGVIRILLAPGATVRIPVHVRPYMIFPRGWNVHSVTFQGGATSYLEYRPLEGSGESTEIKSPIYFPVEDVRSGSQVINPKELLLGIEAALQTETDPSPMLSVRLLSEVILVL